jgi:hypothetical protein
VSHDFWEGALAATLFSIVLWSAFALLYWLVMT